MDFDKLINKYLLEGMSKEQFNEYFKYQETDYLDNYKFVILNKLSESDRRIILLYTETGNLRDTAKYLNCSFTKLSYVIKNIREKLTNIYLNYDITIDTNSNILCLCYRHQRNYYKFKERNCKIFKST